MHTFVRTQMKMRAGLGAGTTRATGLRTASRAAPVLIAIWGLLMMGLQPLAAQTESVLYSFAGQPDGANPYYSSVVRDAAGNLYGTTLNGGANGFGSVYKLTPAGVETWLYSFASSPDGANPYGGLVIDKKGNLFGVTYGGGNGYGTVFEVTAAGTEKVLYSFLDIPDGSLPIKALALGKKDTVYGTTNTGGAYGFGSVFEVTAGGVEKVLYSFTGGSDGGYPSGGVVMDKLGNLYGTTTYGGGGGVVYELTPTGAFSVLYTFTGGADGGLPYTTPILDKHGNLYGTTAGGGAGCGTVYELAFPSWTETVLHTFDYTDGCYADSAVAMGKKNTLYGTTYLGGGNGYGTIYKVTTSGNFVDLYDFTGGADGGNPLAGVIFDKSGNVYSTTNAGGASGNGTLFKLTP